MTTRTLTALLLTLFGLLALAGCSSDDPASPAVTAGVTAESDAAATIAADLGADDGGLIDQVNDAVTFAQGFDPSAKSGGCEGLRDAVYDEETGTWTITVERERGDPDGVPYAAFTRVFMVRFLDAEGLPQMRYLEDGTAAVTIEFGILSGTGVRRTQRMEHNLLSLESAFVVTDADQDLVTINGTFARSAGTVLTNPALVRTHDSTLQLELMDVVAPRDAGRDLSLAVSGTVTGVYDALITFTKGDDYREREIHREFTVVLGDGEGAMTMGQTRNQYRLRLKTGELVGE